MKIFSYIKENKRHKLPLICLTLMLFTLTTKAQITVSFTWDTVCLGENTILTSTSSSAGTIIEENWDFDGDSLFDEASAGLVSIQFPTSGIQSVGLQIIDDLGDTAFLYDDVVVQASPSAAFTFNTVCLGDSTQFTNNSVENGAGSLTFNWDFGDGSSSSAVSTQHEFTNATSYSVELLAMATNGCSDSVAYIVQVRNNPTVSITAPFGSFVCPFDSTLLTGSASTTLAFWSNGSSNDSIYAQDTGWVYLVATDSFACIGRDSILLVPADSFNLETSNDTSVVLGNSVQLTASGLTTYIWQPDEYIDDATSSSPMVSPIEDTEYMVIGYSSQNCKDTGLINVDVLSDYSIDYTNLITPNGDGANDVFTIRNIGYFQGCPLRIYNKMGDLLYTSDDTYQNDWDGTYGGSSLPEDVYYFTIECEQEGNAFSGAITILK